ncbi:MAG: hypothetical protein IPK83_17305 [Planctomycetes bacterium]|nr:hypothetical protein [Planctomycetota bacterium]
MQIERTMQELSVVMTRYVLSEAANSGVRRFSDREITLCELMVLAQTLSDAALERLADIASHFVEYGVQR